MTLLSHTVSLNQHCYIKLVFLCIKDFLLFTVLRIQFSFRESKAKTEFFPRLSIWAPGIKTRDVRQEPVWVDQEPGNR